MKRLLEDKRQELINKSKHADNYVIDQSKGKNRYERRLQSRILNSVKEFNKIDMNTLFKDNILLVNVNIAGETNNYIVKIKFGSILNYIHDQLTSDDQKVDLRIITRALVSAFNSDDVYIHCSCLHPDTKIKLLDGSTPTIAEMLDRFNSGEQLYVYSVDEKGDFKPGIVEKVWITKTTSEFIKVTLDNDQEIITTPDHLYMLRDGSYKQAQNLKVGQSLMPLYFNTWRNGYDGIKLNSTGKYHSVYKLVANYFKSNEIEEAKHRINESDNMKYDIAIHHKDFNKHNNNPENLIPMTAREHWNYHSTIHNNMSEEAKKHLSDLMKKRNANPTEAMVASRKAYFNKGQERNKRIKDRSTDEYEFQAEVMRQAIKKFYANVSEEELAEIAEKRRVSHQRAIERGCLNTPKFKEAAKKRGIEMHTPEREILIKAGIKRYWENLSDSEREKRADIMRQTQKKSIEKIKGQPLSEKHKENIRKARLNESLENLKEHTRKIMHSKILWVLNYLLNNNLELTNENYKKHKRSGDPFIEKWFNSIDEAVSYFELNHKITNIEYITLPNTPVYDIKVKDYENFLVDAGVILHNCPDFLYRFSYWSLVNNISSDPEIEQKNNGREIVNPNDTKGRGCKHVLLVLTRSRWLRNVASVIYNYINYMEKHYPKLYADIIYPAIYEKEYEEPVQLSIDDLSDEEKEVPSEEDTIDTSNKWAKTKSQFKPGNEYRFQPANKEIEGQKSFDFDSLMSD